MLGGATCALWRMLRGHVVGDLLESPQAVIDRRLGELHPPRQLAEVELRVGAAPAGHLPQRSRQGVELADRLEPLDGGRLTQPRTYGLADVGSLEVEAAVHLAADLTHDPHAFEFHDRAARTHPREQAHDAVALFHIDDVLAATIHHPDLRAGRLGNTTDHARPRLTGRDEFEVVARRRRVDRPAAE